MRASKGFTPMAATSWQSSKLLTTCNNVLWPPHSHSLWLSLHHPQHCQMGDVKWGSSNAQSQNQKSSVERRTQDGVGVPHSLFKSVYRKHPILDGVAPSVCLELQSTDDAHSFLSPSYTLCTNEQWTLPLLCTMSFTFHRPSTSSALSVVDVSKHKFWHKAETSWHKSTQQVHFFQFLWYKNVLYSHNATYSVTFSFENTVFHVFFVL